jgi:hypothetical protein
LLHNFHVQFVNFLAVFGIVEVDQLGAILQMNGVDAIDQRQQMAKNWLNFVLWYGAGKIQSHIVQQAILLEFSHESEH